MPEMCVPEFVGDGGYPGSGVESVADHDGAARWVPYRVECDIQPVALYELDAHGSDPCLVDT